MEKRKSSFRLIDSILVTLMIMSYMMNTHTQGKLIEHINTSEQDCVRVVREHERQLIFSEVMTSQRAWENASIVLTEAYDRERAKRIELEQKLKEISNGG